MKYTIFSFQQVELLKLNLDAEDALILSVIKDMYSSKYVEYKIINNDRYIWINQTYLLEQIPIIGTKRKLQMKLKLYEDIGLIERKMEHIKDDIKGNFSYINTTKKLDLLSEYVSLYEGGGCEKNSQGLRKNFARVTKNFRNKDSSIKDSSIRDIDIYSRVIDYLNEKADSNYKHTTKKTQNLIKARVEEGFKEEDFYKVIDKKVSEWKDTDFSKYLRPETLFGTKFEGYLNQEVKMNGKYRSNGSTGQNTEKTKEGKFKESGYRPPKPTGIHDGICEEDTTDII